MLEARRAGSPGGVASRSTAGTRDTELTDFLLDILESAESYDAPILRAERDEDPELLAFLRELRRQDVVRTTGAVRLLRRPPGQKSRYPEQEIGA